MMISAHNPALTKWESRSGHNNELSRHDSSSRVKPLPPFGKQGAEYLKEYGRPLNGVWIVSGDCGLWGSSWGFAKMCNRLPHRIGLVYPLDRLPEEYSWVVDGCECLLWLSCIPDEIASRLGEVLLSSGATSVKILQVNSQNKCSLAVYRKETVNDAF